MASSSPGGRAIYTIRALSGISWRILRRHENPRGKTRKKRGKTSFLVKDQLLEICKSALLRRNISASQPAGHPYFAGKSDSPAPPPVTISRGIAMFAHVVRAIRAWKRYHQSLSELNRLGDRELADIGISRSDIPRVAWNAAHKL
jgi:uncharacterized protein YjiS (DUF1127 family)